MPPVVRLVSVEKTNRMGEVDVRALRSVSVDLERGQMVAIMGASGSGKSTTLNVIGTLERPTSGSYFLDDEPVDALDEEELADLRNRKIGFARGSRVCVIGHEVHEELLRATVPLDGLRLEIDGRLFSVGGVLEKKPLLGATDATYIWDRKVLIPETTYDALYAPSHEVEAVGLSAVGALVGIVAGVLLAWLTALLASSTIGEWELAVPAWSLGLGLGLALATGVVFGAGPAWRAARLSPIDALRSE